LATPQPLFGQLFNERDNGKHIEFSHSSPYSDTT
jgi:hypothetical protein